MFGVHVLFYIMICRRHSAGLGGPDVLHRKPSFHHNIFFEVK
jgi:hypothetical protein